MQFVFEMDVDLEDSLNANYKVAEYTRQQNEALHSVKRKKCKILSNCCSISKLIKSLFT